MVLTSTDEAKAAHYLANIKNETNRQRSRRTALQKYISLYTITPQENLGFTDPDVDPYTSQTTGNYEVLDNANAIKLQVDFNYELKDHHGDGFDPILDAGSENYVAGPVQRYKRKEVAIRLNNLTDLRVPTQSAWDFNFTTQFSLEIKFKLDSIMDFAAGYLFGKTATVFQGTGWCLAKRSSDNKVRFAMENASNQGIDFYANDTVLNNYSKWYHIIFTKTTGSTVSACDIYIDNDTSQAKVNVNDDATGSALNDDDLYIGTNHQSEGHLHADVAFARIYTIRLTQAQVALRMAGKEINANGAVSPPANLWGCDWAA